MKKFKGWKHHRKVITAIVTMVFAVEILLGNLGNITMAGETALTDKEKAVASIINGAETSNIITDPRIYLSYFGLFTFGDCAPG